MTKSHHKDTVAVAGADTDTDTVAVAVTGTGTGTGTGTDTDTDTDEINPLKKGTVPFFSARRVLGGGGLRFGPRSLGVRRGAALLVLVGNTLGPNARTSRGVLLRSG